jgi:hypothetical protein
MLPVSTSSFGLAQISAGGGGLFHLLLSRSRAAAWAVRIAVAILLWRHDLRQRNGSL